jgi:trk system potassium uptake protein TrkH
MHFSLIRALLGLLLLIFSATMLVPILFALWYHEQTIDVFLKAFAITAATGALLWLPNRRPKGQMRVRDGFLITALFWLVLGAFGALPLYLTDALSLSITDAFFESVSGLTTTGATVITGLDVLPRSILYYRQQLQWLGGIGIIVIAIAILPMLGVGGMQLYRAETPGPMKDTKLTPRITSTAKVLFAIYLTITCACGLCYWLAGMTPFDALAHSFTTVAIGGFSTHDTSMNYFNSLPILWISIVFMLLAAVNFGLHYFAFRDRTLKSYWQDSELRFFYLVVALSAVLVCALLSWHFLLPLYQQDLNWTSPLFDLISHGTFQVVSLATTTGFVSTDYTQWPLAAPVFIFLLAFMGACAGSTGGGMKAIRVLLIIKQVYRELLRLIHPNAVIPIKLGKNPVQDNVVAAIWSFFAIYITAFILLFMLVLLTGMDFVSAFSAVGASINNLGPGLGEVALNYATIPNPAKWILCFTMLLGRLEVFTLLVLFVPAFWRK